MTVYIDGGKATRPPAETNDWKQTSSFYVPLDVTVIAIECVVKSLGPGILASVAGNDAITDSSWMCSAVHEDGWEKENFTTTAGNWDAATEIAQHGDLPWGLTPLISKTAKWIWTQKHTWPNNIDKHVYCRKVFSNFHCND